MVGIVVATHGRLAEELLSTAEGIVGVLPQARPVSIGADASMEEQRARLGEAIQAVDSGDGVLVLTDMFGGTPTNLAMSLLDPGRIEVVTGVNLPMLIKFANLRGDGTLHEVAKRLAAQGRDSIQSASDLLEGGPGAGR